MASGSVLIAPACLTTIAGLVSVLLVFVVATRQYEAMLTTAIVPLCMQASIAEYLLWLLFKISTRLRKSRPAAQQQRMQAAALEKIQLLESASPRISPGGVCFIGSSTFTYWRHLSADMAELEVPVFNAAFGGSCTEDVWLNMERLCTQHRPQVVVYFCGTNNIAQGMEASSVLQGFELFMSRLRELTPSPRSLPHVVYLGLTLTPFYSTWNINNAINGVQQVNRLMQRYCEAPQNRSQITFVSTDGPECAFVRNPASYLGDRHHLNDAGHAELAAILLPHICSAITCYDGPAEDCEAASQCMS